MENNKPITEKTFLIGMPKSLHQKIKHISLKKMGRNNLNSWIRATFVGIVSRWEKQHGKIDD